jgi:predicted PurR-regulated permease PerM
MAEPARELLPREARHGEASTSTTPVDVSGRNIALVIVAGAAAMYVLWWAQEVFIPIVLSVLISYALEPPVLWLMRIRLPRIVASAVIVTLLTGVVGYGLYALYGEGAAIVATLPEAAQKFREVLRRSDTKSGAIQRVQQAAAEIEKTAKEATGETPPPRGVQRVEIVQPAFNMRDYLTWGSASLMAFAGQAVLVVFFVFFLLAAGDLFKRKLVKVVGRSLEKKKITVQILDEIDTQIELFLFVRVITSTVVGVATWLAFRFVGLEQAGFWGMCAGIFNSIPYFGPVIVAGATALVGFLQFGTIGMALYVSGMSLVITSLEGWLLTPWLTSRTARTNEVAIFVGLIFWSFVWGIWGTLLAVPMLVVVKACCDRIEDLKPIGELLGE